jgi:tRNA-2-methylthio-N6-dimethylallyladenosine synthase
MNEYDTLKIQKILENDYKRVETPENADLVLINTCSVRDKPEQKLYSMLGELNDLKKIRPDLKIGVCGCVAQQEGERIVKRSKAVDLVFGTHNLSLIPSLLKQRENGAPPQVAVNYREEWEDLPLGFSEVDKVSVFVSISRGCNKNCTYCIVPTTRGKEVSRSLDEIEREVKIAVFRGAKEVTLLGQTVNSYGKDFTPRQSFASLLERLSKIEGLERIRFTSPHPQEVREDFIDLVSNNPKICKHIHMPLQSGSDRILKLMNRNYRKKRYLEIIQALKDKVPDIAITTDIIVGFPGETRSDFEETLEVMKEVEFENSFSFMFSPRPGTKAALMKEEISQKEKLERLQELQALQFDITKKRLEGWIGRRGEVLVEGESPYQNDPQKGENQTIYYGRLSQNITVNFIGSGSKPGSIVEVDITGSSRFTLKGSLTESASV